MITQQISKIPVPVFPVTLFYFETHRKVVTYKFYFTTLLTRMSLFLIESLPVLENEINQMPKIES